MANQFLASFKFGAESDEKEEVCRTAVAKICVKVHTSINETGDRFYNELRRKTYTTPKSYLDLIGMYSSKLGELQGLVDIKIEQMEVGCAKLAETNAVVDGLRGELKELAPVLEQKAADAEVMLKQVAVDQAEADVVKEKVSAEEATLAKQSAEVKAVADDAQADLDVAMPALNNAVKALDSLTKADITEVKAFAKPVRVAVSFLRRRRASSPGMRAVGVFFRDFECIRTAVAAMASTHAGPRRPDHDGGRLHHVG